MTHHQQENKTHLHLNLHIQSGAQTVQRRITILGALIDQYIYIRYILTFSSTRKDKYNLEKELAEESEKDMTQCVHILRGQYHEE